MLVSLPVPIVPFLRSLPFRKFSAGVGPGVQTEDQIINVGLHSPTLLATWFGKMEEVCQLWL